MTIGGRVSMHFGKWVAEVLGQRIFWALKGIVSGTYVKLSSVFLK